MSRKSTEKKLARAVQDEVVLRRGGMPPSYGHCLQLVREHLALRPKEDDELPPAEWQADLVAACAGMTS